MHGPSSGPSPSAGAPPALRTLLDGIDMLSRLDGWLGVLCLVSLTALMIAEVAVRALSNVIDWVPADIPVAWEYSSYLMAACFTFGAAMTLRAGGHIRVTLVLARVSPGTRRAMETVLAALGTFFCGFLGWSMAYFSWRSFDTGQTSVSSGTLVWMPQALVTFGILLLTVQFAARFLQALFGLPLEDLNMRAGSVAE
jgi:TRAP-type C4-dicarboxylate transport system permease small subunit